MRIGVLGAADIAFRRFLPALALHSEFSYAGVASRSIDKAAKFEESFGGRIYSSYEALLDDNSIEAVYVPLPPALHSVWGKRVLESGKHLLMEKPFTVSASDTQELIRIAEERNLAVHENYMFLYHKQLQQIKEMIAEGRLGELRLIRMAFGFPKRNATDFRYSRELGGGALLDCGGYPLRLAWEFLGADAYVTQACLNTPMGYEVDIFGEGVLESNTGYSAQVAFGMDNAYKCELEIWGSKGNLRTGRIFTAGPGFIPAALLWEANTESELKLSEDNAFLNSISHFYALCTDSVQRHLAYKNILHQAQIIEQFRRMAKNA